MQKHFNECNLRDVTRAFEDYVDMHGGRHCLLHGLAWGREQMEEDMEELEGEGEEDASDGRRKGLGGKGGKGSSSALEKGDFLALSIMKILFFNATSRNFFLQAKNLEGRGRRVGKWKSPLPSHFFISLSNHCVIIMATEKNKYFF